MQLINCKVALKLEWANHYVLSAVGADNDHANSNNIIFTIKEIKLYLPVVLHQQKTIKNHQIFLAKNSKYQSIGMNLKQKVRIKIRQSNIVIFSNQNF